MKTIFNCLKQCLLAFAFVTMAVQICFAQIEFTEHTIAGDFNGAWSVHAADIDGDGDMDVLGAAFIADEITWWENDGEQEFTEHTIAGDFDGAYSVYAADIDNDGDMDVLGVAAGVDDINWWENNGEQDFTEHTIAGDFDGACFVYAADIDGDGDMDVLGAARVADDITWWENDGEQDFTEHTIASDFGGAHSVFATDIDSDDDLDVLGAAEDANTITWWENDGEQDFTERTIAGEFGGASSVYAEDIDGDGDIDVLGAADSAGDITWWENDGEQDFTEHTIDGNFGRTNSVYAVDIDSDGDMDVLGAALAGDISWWESDLDPGGLSGFIFDFENDQPLEGAVVSTSYGVETVADEDGYWQIIPVTRARFDLTARMTGYNDSTFFDLEVEPFDTLEINIGLLHPELLLSEAEIVAELEPEGSAEHHLTIQNEGNGLLEWSMKLRLVGESGVDPWALRGSYNAGQTVEDSRLQGVVFIDDHYYVSGGGNDVHMIYILDIDGNLVGSFPQFGQSSYGMKDLAWDGELIWGVADETVYGFSTEGDSVTSFQGPFNPNSAITWDTDRELLWISGITTDIHGYDRQGNHDQEHEISRKGLLIYGLANLPEESTSLYIFNTPGDNRQVIYKMNPDNGDTVFVRELTPENGGSPAGAFITDQYDMYGSWVFMDIVNDGSDDRIDIWQLKPNTGWMGIEPIFGRIEPNDNQELVLTLNAAGLDSTFEWQGEMIFSQSVGGDEIIVPITLTIRTNAVSDKDLQQPSEFGISSVYPNPFNAVTRLTYGLPLAGRVSLSVFDIAGRQVATLFNGDQTAGMHSVSWNAESMPSGLYIVRLKASGQVFTQKVMLLL